MANYSELIKNFEKMRDFVRDFFINGFKTRDDFDKKASRTYSDEKRRIECWLGEDKFISVPSDKDGRIRKYAIIVDSRRINENPFYQAYYAKSFPDSYIILHFYLLDLLKDGKEYNVKQLSSNLYNSNLYNMYEDFEDQKLISENTVLEKLREYVKEGLVIEKKDKKDGRIPVFSLSPDRTDEWLQKFEGLEDALKFFSESCEFGVVGNSMLRSEHITNDLFCRKHNFIVYALEDEALLEILRAIKQKRVIRFDKFKPDTFKDNPKAKKDYFVPMQISVSTQTGRRYLMGYTNKRSGFVSIGLDEIHSVKIDEVCENYDRIYEEYRQKIRNNWGVSYGGSKPKTRQLKMTIQVGGDENYIVKRLEREKRSGRLTRISDRLYEVELDVFDTMEPRPWIRSFIGSVVKLDGSDNDRKRFPEDLAQMNEMYNGDQNEDIQ